MKRPKKNIIKSFNYAVTGLLTGLKVELYMKVHYVLGLLAIILAIFLDLPRPQFLILSITISLVFMAELINTAIEYTVDLVTEEFHPLAKIAKDIAAGAVLVAVANSLIVGYLLFFDRLAVYGESVIGKIKNSPTHLTFITLILVIILTIGLKAIFYKGKGSHFQGGTVSGHASISFAMATIISLLSEDALIASLALLLAFLVGESRVEGKIHSFGEVLVGGILGVVVGVLVFKFIW